MERLQRERGINTYFSMWVQRDFSALDEMFASDIYYSECYGPEYHGMEEIRRWIDDMLRKQKVLTWRVKRFLHAENTVVAEWFFLEVQQDVEHGFDGVSIIEFQRDGKISSVKEFASKWEHVAPYHAGAEGVPG